MLETGGTDMCWRQVVQTYVTERWHRQVVDRCYRHVLETGGTDMCWRQVVQTCVGDRWYRHMLQKGGTDKL